MSNVLTGNVPTEETIKGKISVAHGFDGKSAYEIAVENGFIGTEEEWAENLNRKVYPTDQTYNPESENPQSGKAVAEALSTKASAIVIPYSGSLAYSVSRPYSNDEAKMSSFMLYGKSTQASGTPSPTNILEIASAENPTIVVGADVNSLEIGTVYTFNDITLRGIGSVRDELVLKDGRIKLIQKVFYKKDFSDVEFKNSNMGFQFDITDFDIDRTKKCGMCNMLTYSTNSNSMTPYNQYYISGNILYGWLIMEIVSGMTVEEWKSKYAANIELFAPLATPIETDVTEQFLDNLNVRVSGNSSYIQFDTNLASASFSYIEETKAYIDQKFNELATALVANA